MIRKMADGTVIGTFTGASFSPGLPDGITSAAAARAQRIRDTRKLRELGFTMSEIASKLGITRGTVWNYLHPDAYEAKWRAQRAKREAAP